MAIIVVLAAVALPTFGRQLETARETGDMEIVRSAYTEALALAVLDASDGTLDGKNGSATNLAVLIDTKVASTAAAAAAAGDNSTAIITGTGLSDNANAYRYTVTLANMKPAASMKQSTEGWQFVNSSLLGTTVPAVDQSTTAIAFQFEISDSSVNLLATNGIVVKAVTGT